VRDRPARAALSCRPTPSGEENATTGALSSPPRICATAP
jgi:hypothetical protein